MADLEYEAGKLAMLAEDIGQSVAGAEAAGAAFRSELEGMQGAMSAAGVQAGGLSKSLGSSLKSAFDDLIFDGARLSDVLAGVGRSVAGSVYNAAMTPVTNGIGSAIGGGLQSLISAILPFANGAAFSAGRVRPFADGGVVSGATSFPMRGGQGLMGEAGPEAIMPLARGADGKLGVRGGGGGIQVTMQISTPDAESFRRSSSQVAASLTRALGRGRRNM